MLAVAQPLGMFEYLGLFKKWHFGHMLWTRSSIVYNSVHLVGRGGEGEWLLELVAHVQTQFQVLDKKD